MCSWSVLGLCDLGDMVMTVWWWFQLNWPRTKDQCPHFKLCSLGLVFAWPSCVTRPSCHHDLFRCSLNSWGLGPVAPVTVYAWRMCFLVFSSWIACVQLQGCMLPCWVSWGLCRFSCGTAWNDSLGTMPMPTSPLQLVSAVFPDLDAEIIGLTFCDLEFGREEQRARLTHMVHWLRRPTKWSWASLSLGHTVAVQ